MDVGSHELVCSMLDGKKITVQYGVLPDGSPFMCFYNAAGNKITPTKEYMAQFRIIRSMIDNA